MPERPLIIYYECIDNAIDASYSTIIDSMRSIDFHTTSLDSFSDAYQIEMAKTGIRTSPRSLLIVDSRKGKEIKGLTILLNLLRNNNGQLLWLGEHAFAEKAIAMVTGQKTCEKALKMQLTSWINQL